MLRLLGSSFVLALLLVPGLALAKEKDKKDKDKKDKEEEEDFAPDVEIDEGDFKDDDDDGAPPPKRIEEGDSDDAEDAPDDLKLGDDAEDDDIDFRDDTMQETVKERLPGEDTAELYRKAQDQSRDMNVDEELLLWEKYLAKYPKSLFKDRIERRVEELSAEMFNERIEGTDSGRTGVKDAALRELNFANPVQFTTIDPRSRASVGFDLGIPNYFAPRADFEWAFMRQFSARAGIKQEHTNFAINLGAKYALIKSARTKTILTTGLDFKVYTSPAFPDLYPWVAFGQRIDVLDGLDLQLQVGVDTELRDPLGARFSGGFNAELKASEMVSAFVETTGEFKYLNNDDYGPFRFMTATFGLKFRGAKARNDDGDGRLDVGLAANIPYSYNYWGFYRGAVSVDADYAL